jgi:hypothetical protein
MALLLYCFLCFRTTCMSADGATSPCLQHAVPHAARSAVASQPRHVSCCETFGHARRPGAFALVTCLQVCLLHCAVHAAAFLCPPDGLMCGDPGFLTCKATRNDCSANGDCYKGHCYCFLGWGGEDCSISVCTEKCPDVRCHTCLHWLAGMRLSPQL